MHPVVKVRNSGIQSVVTAWLSYSMVCSVLYKLLIARSCYLMPATPATPASYIKGTATDNINMEKSAYKSVRN